jgi:hypothetical protein
MNLLPKDSSNFSNITTYMKAKKPNSEPVFVIHLFKLDAEDNDYTYVEYMLDRLTDAELDIIASKLEKMAKNLKNDVSHMRQLMSEGKHPSQQLPFSDL